MQPGRVGRHPRELRRLEVGVVPEQATGVVQHLGVVGIRAAQLERDRDGVAVAIEVGIGPLQMQSDQPPQGAVRGRSDGRPARGRPPPPDGARPPTSDIASSAPRFGSAGFSCESATQRRDGVGEFALLEVDQPQPGVDFGPTPAAASAAARTTAARRRSVRRRAPVPLAPTGLPSRRAACRAAAGAAGAASNQGEGDAVPTARQRTLSRMAPAGGHDSAPAQKMTFSPSWLMRPGSRAIHHAEGRRRQAGVDRIELRVIERVERLEPELQLGAADAG